MKLWYEQEKKGKRAGKYVAFIQQFVGDMEFCLCLELRHSPEELKRLKKEAKDDLERHPRDATARFIKHHRAQIRGEIASIAYQLRQKRVIQ